MERRWSEAARGVGLGRREAKPRVRYASHPMERAADLLSTRQLIDLAKQGDDQALEVLFRRYLTPLRRWARGRLPNWARGMVDTDDLVQESLLGSLRTMAGFVPEQSGAFQSYLREALRNRLRDELRRAGRRPSGDAPGSDLPDPSLSPVEAAMGRENLERFEIALRTLSPSDRDAVVARVELGFSYEEIADLLGKASVDAARMAVKRAIARLARAMAVSG